MQLRKDHSAPDPEPAPAHKHEFSGPPDFSAPQQPIADLVARPDFPEGLLGQHVMIGGYSGVIVAIVKNSIKVRSPEGITRGFNVFGLRRIYGPPPEVQPMPAAPPTRPTPPPPPAEPAPPKRNLVTQPDFTQAVIPIAQLVAQPDFPRCAFGKHIQVGGYTGVVIEIVNQSLKVRSAQGVSRSYNVPGLRHIYEHP